MNEYSDEPPAEVADDKSNGDKNDGNGENTTLSSPSSRNTLMRQSKC